MPTNRRPTDLTRRALRWLPAIAWAAVIFSASAVPGSQIPGRFGNVAHVGEYLIFGVLLFVAMRADRLPLRAAVLALLIASAYGVSDEFHQAFVPMRTPDVADWGRDTLGAAMGVSLALLAIRLRAEKGFSAGSKRQ